MAKIMLVNGSPRKQGCTNTALSLIAEMLEAEGIDSEIFWIGNKPIADCIGCYSCQSTGHCIVKDDKVSEFLQQAKGADGFIFGSPVYYGSATGALTSFMDRVFLSELVNGNPDFYLKPAAAIVSARRAGTTSTVDQLNKYFMLHEMPIISSVYWNMVHGDTPEEVMHNKEGLWTMRTLARNMAYFVRCQEVASQVGVT